MTNSPESDLRSVLACFPPDCRPQTGGIVPVAGGFSGAGIWRVQAPRGELCLRRWPQSAAAAKRLTGINHVLQQAADAGCDFLALPIATTDNSPGRGLTFLQLAGHVWGLEPWLAGEAELSPVVSAQHVQAALSALAQFHVVTFDCGKSEMQTSASQPFLPQAQRITERLQTLRLAGDQVPALQAAMGRSGQDSLAIDLLPAGISFLERLPTAIDEAESLLQRAIVVEEPNSQQPCLGDVWREHVLFQRAEGNGVKVSGIVDYGAMAYGDVAWDICRLLASYAEESPLAALSQRGVAEPSQPQKTWQAGLNAYRAIRPLTEADAIRLAGYRAVSAVLSGLNWLRWIFLEQRSFDQPAAVLRRFNACEARLRHFLRRPELIGEIWR